MNFTVTQHTYVFCIVLYVLVPVLTFYKLPETFLQITQKDSTTWVSVLIMLIGPRANMGHLR